MRALFTRETIRIQAISFDGDGCRWRVVCCVCRGRLRSGYITWHAGPELCLWCGRSSNIIWKTQSHIWTYWWSNGLDQIVPIFKIDVRLFQWQCIFRDINRLWFAARFSTWAVVFPFIHSTTTATHRKTRFQGTCSRRRFTDIRSHTFNICIYTSCTFFRLHRCSEELDGMESIASESIKNRDDLAGIYQAASKLSNVATGVWITPSSKVRNLGVIIDDALTMSAHVSKLVSTCFFHLRQLRMVRRSLDVDAAHALVRALIHSRLDYCNGVLAGLPLYMFKRLQSVLNAAARLVLPGRQSVSIPMRNRLHWLGFPQCAIYKLCVLSYKCLHGLAPEYLSRRCVRIIDIPGHAHLRSASACQLVVPSTIRKTLGDRGCMEQSSMFPVQRCYNTIFKQF